MCSTLTDMKLHNGEIISDDWAFDFDDDSMNCETVKKLPWLSGIDKSDPRLGCCGQRD
jgi:hypothetical protein